MYVQSVTLVCTTAVQACAGYHASLCNKNALPSADRASNLRVTRPAQLGSVIDGREGDERARPCGNALLFVVCDTLSVRACVRVNRLSCS